MPDLRPPGQDRGKRALDLLNFFLANVQTGFGPFVAVYLTAHKWTEGDIGLMLSVGTIVGVASQLPAGALVDATTAKRAATATAIGGIMAAALLLALWPVALGVMAAEVLHGIASSVLTPAIAALSLRLVGRAALGERLGRNAAFGAVGNGLAAAAMGAAGSTLGTRAVFWLTAALGVPALAAVALLPRQAVRRADAPPEATGPAAAPEAPRAAAPFRTSIVALLSDRRLLIFAAALVLFFLANAEVLPLAASLMTRQAGTRASLIIAAAIVLPQAVVALTSGWVGREAERRGRRPLLVLGWTILPLPGVLLALLPTPAVLLAGQALGGVSAAVIGVMLPLTAADLTRESGHFNLCIGLFGLCAAGGATLGTALGGALADMAGNRVAFLCLAAIGLAGAALLATFMPETRAATPAGRVDPREAPE
ncbi:MAG: MFS transporter [Proteobacteria bacterium]|nr:MFS transporter [Pseudomonadota bacterium]